MTVIFRRPSRVSGLESMTGIDDMTPWRLLHRHFEIVMAYRGFTEARAVRQAVSSRGRYVNVVSDTMNVLLPGDFHETVRQRVPGTFQVLLIEPEHVSELLPEVERLDRLHFVPGVFSVTPSFRALCRRVHRLIGVEAEPLAVEETAARLLRATVALAGEPELRAKFSLERRPDPAVIRKVVDYLEAHHSESPDLRQLAEIAGYDRFRLVRAFRLITGVTPHQYLVQIRIGRARARLAVGEPITTVALDSGFFDQSHFHRHFKAIVGVTPGEYASASRQARRR